jgi:hypothetical protein
MSERRVGASGEAGQATLEWVGLVLLAALVLGAAAALAAGSAGSDRGLGDTLATRITGAAASVGSRKAGVVGPADPAASVAPVPAAGAAAGPAAPARAGAAPDPRARTAPVPRARAAEAFHRLRGVAWIAKRAWIVCLGYKRFRYELEHPRAPMEPMPVDAALGIANACLNPYSFLGGD